MNNVRVNQPPPTGYAPPQTQAAFNNTYAKALANGDPRFNAKQYDRGGISRGGAQWGQAGIDASQKMSEGIADAYSQRASDASYNAGVALQGQQAQEAYAQSLAALQQQSAQAQAMAQLQRQQQSMNFVSSLLGGLLR